MSGGVWTVYAIPTETINPNNGRPRPRLDGAVVVRDQKCPDGPHPTRNCGCMFFRHRSDAEAYAATKNSTSPEEGNHHGTAA